jgi:N-methylhydantoinase B/oxoprolinase/acetone carboxylase alpha subunit
MKEPVQHRGDDDNEGAVVPQERVVHAGELSARALRRISRNHFTFEHKLDILPSKEYTYK